MKNFSLILFTRSGCCLCEGLENRLKQIDLRELNPPLEMQVVDIDSELVSEIEREFYTLKVPVMAISLKNSTQLIELPRVSPRLKEKGLLFWMQKTLNQIID